MEEASSPEMSLSSRALHLAVRTGSTSMVKFLLWTGASVTSRDSKTKRSVLHLACENSNNKNMQDIINMLVRYGADINAEDTEGRTPLQEACVRKNQTAVDTLLSVGAKTSVVKSGSVTHFHDVLSHCDDFELVWFLENLLTDSESFGGGGGCSYDDQDLWFAVNRQNENGDAALHIASKRNNKEVVLFLLRLGATVGMRNFEGLTSLHLAAVACAGDVVPVLVDNGEDVNAVDFKGNTPLHLACSRNDFKDNSNSKTTTSRVKTIENLLSKGANIYEKNECMKTPYEELDECYSSENPSLEVRMKIEELFIKHVTMLRILNIQEEFDFDWLSGPDYSDKISSECCCELKSMKSTIIANDISLTELLSHANQLSVLSPDDLRIISENMFSLEMLNRYPIYGPSLRNFFKRLKMLTLGEADCEEDEEDEEVFP